MTVSVIKVVQRLGRKGNAGGATNLPDTKKPRSFWGVAFKLNVGSCLMLYVFPNFFVGKIQQDRQQEEINQRTETGAFALL